MGVTARTDTYQCPECGGRGWNYSRHSTCANETCMRCFGSGQVVHAASYTLTNDIPLVVSQTDQIADLRAKIADLEARIALLEPKPPSTVAACGMCGAAVHTDSPMWLGPNGPEYICRDCPRGEDDA